MRLDEPVSGERLKQRGHRGGVSERTTAAASAGQMPGDGRAPRSSLLSPPLVPWPLASTHCILDTCRRWVMAVSEAGQASPGARIYGARERPRTKSKQTSK